MTYNDFTQRFEFDPNADQLGEGGFGRVYKAWDNTRREDVALKIAPVPPGMEELSLLQEFERVRHLMHGNIAIYLDCHRLDFPMMGRHDVAYMKYYQTGHLGQLLDQERLTPAQKEHVLLGILSGIEYLHSRQPFIIHRDLKPANILVVPRAGQYHPLITDFGISRSGATDAGKSFVSNTLKAFSLNFAAPEQADGDTLRRNADLWSFGVIVAYVWLDGRLPFRTESLDLTTDTGQQGLRQRIRDLDLVAQVGALPEPWQALVRRCLVLDPAQRLASCQEARQLLAPAAPGMAPASEPTRVLAPAPALAPTPEVSPPVVTSEPAAEFEPVAAPQFPLPAGQKKWRALVGGGVGLVAVVGAAAWLLQRGPTYVPLKSFLPKPNALAVAVTDGLRLTFLRTPTAADMAGIRVFSSQYRGLRSLKTTINDSVATLSPVGGDFRPGEVIAVSLPTGTPVQGGSNAQVYQFTVAASVGPAVFRSGARVAVGEHPGDVVLGDVDGDGDLDMLAPNFNGNTVNVRLNDGKGHFTAPAANPNVPVGAHPHNVVLGDVDGDGDLDMLTAYDRNTMDVRLNDGKGHFTTPAANPNMPVCIDLALGDVDGDGDLDMLTANELISTVSVRLNDGKGRFTAPATNPDVPLGYSPGSVALGDVDGDGDLDMLTANFFGSTVSVRLNDGKGHFTAPAANPDVPVGKSPMSVVLGDVDGDGDLDMLTANSDSNTVSVRLNDGKGHFTAPAANPDVPVGEHPLNVVLGDVDGDGDLDMLTANSDSNTVSVRLNDGKGHFTAPAANPNVPVGIYPHGVALGDVDGDGDLDMLATNSDSGTVSVLFNERP